MQSEFLVDEIFSRDLLAKFEKYIVPRGSYRFDPDTMKIIPVIDSMSVDTPWIHIKQSGDRYCVLQHIFFQEFDRIPSRCMGCWKVVVAPQTVVQLLDLHDLMVELDYESKCGIEVRPFVPRNYGGYFYQNTKNEALARYREVREAVSDLLSPDVEVSVKRYCTEFELKKGPSKAYNQPKDTAHFEKLFWNLWAREGDLYVPQSKELICHIKRKWMDFAWDRADMTVKSLNDGKPLYTPSDTYHREGK